MLSLFTTKTKENKKNKRKQETTTKKLLFTNRKTKHEENPIANKPYFELVTHNISVFWETFLWYYNLFVFLF